MTKTANRYLVIFTLVVLGLCLFVITRPFFEGAFVWLRDLVMNLLSF